jgi:FkbM family methyltransferase
MLKNTIRNWCQKLMGFDQYLFLFSIANIFGVRFLGYEKEFRYFSNMIDPDGAILDVGANIGIMTVALAKKYPNSTVYAFEPIDENIKAFERACRFYRIKNVQLFATALGDRNEQIKMVMPIVGQSKMQGLTHVVEHDETIIGNVFSVSMQRMDDIEPLNSVSKISAIKIDVENFEFFVLKGGEALLQKHTPLVFCELWNNERRNLCFELMKSLGYRVAVLENGELVEFTAQQALNFFFLPDAN